MSSGGAMSDAAVVRRDLLGPVSAALLDTRVVGVVGPRQAGKSTLVQQIVTERPGATYASLDDPAVRALAQDDPTGFVEGRPGLFAIDEVQRVPELMLAIKASVDRDQRPGRFIVTGSSQLSANRAVSETLAGRIERHTLWPFSQGELHGRPPCLFDNLVSGELPVGHRSTLTKREYLERAVAGGFPEAVRRVDVGRRRAWFRAFVETVIEREAPGISASPRTADLPRLLRLVSARHAGLLNVSDLAADAQLPRTSVLRYLDVLEAVFLTVRIPAWSPNFSQREVRAPKIFLTDPGLAAALSRADVSALLLPEVARGADGALLEGFVLAEVLRQAAAAPDAPTVSHFRDRSGSEVDLLLEVPDGRIVAIEVKAGTGVSASAARHLTGLRDRLGSRFLAGLVLHTGPEAMLLGDRIAGAPLDVLWNWGR
ncbi:MAG: ATP-binding protein [Pseudonocardia sp.]